MVDYPAQEAALKQYLAEVREQWQPDAETNPVIACAVRNLMIQWFRDTPENVAWAQALKDEKVAGRPLYSDPDYGFIQMSHYHAGFRSNLPHDHGPYWVVYGVFEGEVEIPVYVHDEDSATIRCSRVDRLKAGDAVAYLPGEIHSTRVSTRDPAVVLRFLSADLTEVPRQRFRDDQIVGN